eukprot:scaffold38289_cov328-Skeletonema_dohrnii-CCMP3373.AAC.1
MCYGEEDFMQAWTRFLDLNSLTDPANVACLQSPNPSPMGYAESILFGDDDRFPGKARDDPPPSLIGGPPIAGVLVPQSWLDESSEENIKTVLENASQTIPALVPPYYAFGGAAASASDQANSVSQAHRDAAFMMFFFFTADEEANFWGNLFPKMFDISDKTNFPPVFGSNHAGYLTTGPLKEDWTKPCPREWTFKERREKCISFQEAIYGTERLARLEAIKKLVDPQNIFNCANCVGNNLPEVSKSKDDESSPAAAEPVPEKPSESESDEPSGASSVSSFAAAISATAVYVLININMI